MEFKMTITQHRYEAAGYIQRAEEYKRLGMESFYHAACFLAQLHLEERDKLLQAKAEGNQQ